MKHLKPSWKLYHLRVLRKMRRDERLAATKRGQQLHDRNARRAAHIKTLDQVQEEQHRRSYRRH